MLESRTNVSTLQTANSGPEITTENLIQGRRLLRPRVEFGVVLEPAQVGLLHRLHQVPEELVGILLTTRYQVAADDAQFVVDEERTDARHCAILRVLKGFAHGANNA